MSFVGSLTVSSYAQEIELKDLEHRLQQHVIEISHNIGERNYLTYDNLKKAASYIISKFEEYGYIVELETYEIEGRDYSNIIVEKKGKISPDEIIIIGAHYDTVSGSPGADDNTSAIAGLLELARLFSRQDIDKTIRFIAFVNEEPPFFMTEDMGSRVNAKASMMRQDRIIAMVSLEMIGYYNKEKNSQTYPAFLGLFYPNTADFIGFVGNIGSASLINKLKQLFKKHSDFPVEVVAAPSFVRGVDWSDHSSFRQYGYKAMMVTDTSFYRYAHYHSHTDTYEKLDYKSMSEVVCGLYFAFKDLSTVVKR